MGFAFFDIIFFGIIAVILFFRLRDALGTRTGTEKKRPPIFNTLEKQQDTDNKVETLYPNNPTHQDDISGINSTLTKISLQDQNFTPENFLYGAKLAFEFIVEKFAEGDKKAIEPLLSPELMDAFETVIDERANKNHTATTEILNVKKAEIQDAFTKDGNAFITTLFIADETRYIKNKDGDLISGDPNLVTETKDVWTFSRPLNSQDPNWILVETKIEDV